MIPKKKKKPELIPMEFCPSFNKCSANLCPLDPDIDERPYVLGTPTCNAEKPTRLKIGAQFPKLLPFKGFTKKEWSGRKAWASRTPESKKSFIEEGTKNLKTFQNID